MKVRVGRGQCGFTLLELLVVVAIMAALSVSLVEVVQYQEDQQRFELTRTRLEALRFGVFGRDYFQPDEPSAGVHNRSQGGYLVDNGRLPDTVEALVNAPANHSGFELLEPIFDQSPHVDNTCTELDQASNLIGRVDDEPATEDLKIIRFAHGYPVERLAKGYRSGYLPLQIGSDLFVDGWGTVFFFDTQNNTRLMSFGSDGVLGEGTVAENEPNYSTDIAIEVADSDWQQGIEGWSITVVISADDNSSQYFGASILLFENNDSEESQNWRRISTAIVDRADTTADAFTFVFNESTTATDENHNLACRTWLPPGRHVLVVFSDEGGDPHLGNDEEPLMAVPFTVFPRGGTMPNLLFEYDGNVDSDALPS